jgi:hypothetical protein
MRNGLFNLLKQTPHWLVRKEVWGSQDRYLVEVDVVDICSVLRMFEYLAGVV